MALTLSGSTGITTANLASTLDLSSKSITLPAINKSKVIQIVQGTYMTWATTQSTSMVASGLYVDITPISASSTILIDISANGLWAGGTASNTINFHLYKGSNFLASLDRSAHNNDNTYGGSHTWSYIDSPATTTSTRYALWFSTNNASYQVGINNYTNSGNNTTRSTITVMEIAA